MRNYGLVIKLLAVAVVLGIPYQMIVGGSTLGFALWSVIPGVLTAGLAWAIWKSEVPALSIVPEQEGKL